MIPGLKDVKADVLCTCGRQDMICCWEAGRLAVGGIREGGGVVRAELRVYEDCGHFPWVEKKGELLGDVGAFLGVEL